MDEKVAGPRRRLLRYGMRSLLALIAVCAILFGLWNREVQRYRREQVAVVKIDRLGISFEYEDRAPNWLRRLVGDEFLSSLRTVTRISFPPDGAHAEFTGGGSAILIGAKDSELADCRSSLKSLPNLRRLNIRDGQMTAAGIAELQRALPNCIIEQ